MKCTSPLLENMSGTLGGAVASRARGGIAYFRALVIPTNPRTFLQTAIRSAVSSVSAAWINILTEAQQQAWFDAAEGTQSGKSLFGKINQARIYSNNTGRFTLDDGTTASPFDLVLDPPLALSTDFVAPSCIIDDSSNTITLGTVAAGDWNADAALGTPAVLYIYVTPGQRSSRLARQKPYQLVRAISVEDAAAQTVAAINLATLGLPTVAGYVMYVKVYVQSPVGGISIPVEQRKTIVA